MPYRTTVLHHLLGLGLALGASAGLAADALPARPTPFGDDIILLAQGAASMSPGAASAAQRTPTRPRAQTGGAFSGNDTAKCDVLRKRYLDSQACFAPYRLANGGMKREAFKHCKSVPDPSLKCGTPDLPAR